MPTYRVIQEESAICSMPIYRVIQEESAIRREMIVCVILSKKKFI